MAIERSWDSWREHVLAEIKRNNNNLIELEGSLNELHVEIAKLQIKAGVWGLFGGLLPVLVMLVLRMIK